MVSFSIVRFEYTNGEMVTLLRDIVSRAEYGPVDVTAIPDINPVEGSIMYLEFKCMVKTYND
jgi:hypothetical protein